MIQLHRYFLSGIFHSLYQERRLFHWLRKWTEKCLAKKPKTYFRNKWWMLFSSPEPICARKLKWCHDCFFPLSLNVAAEASRSFIMMYYMHPYVKAHLDQRLQIGFDLLFYKYFCYFCLEVLQPSFKWTRQCFRGAPCPRKESYLVLFLYICTPSLVNRIFFSPFRVGVSELLLWWRPLWLDQGQRRRRALGDDTRSIRYLEECMFVLGIWRGKKQ